MKSKIIFALVAIIGVVGLASMGVCGDAPVAHFPQEIFEFEPVLGGSEVMHDFVVQNKGSAELKIEKVKTG